MGEKKVFQVFFHVFLGLGPGGLIIRSGPFGHVPNSCISGSSHGGKGHQGTAFTAGAPYGKDNITSLLGGSGGEIVFIILIFL